MKKVLTFLFAIIILSSCKKEETSDGNSYPQKWKLITMKGQIANSSLSGNNLPYQENYQFNTNKTFTKTREENGTTTSASGTYSVEEFESKIYYMLQYKEANKLIESCYFGSKEQSLYFVNNKLFGGSQPCDGPGLEYQRVN
ncbi:MAG: hypothetical protein ABIP95_03760 [Pelobium sp.]